MRLIAAVDRNWAIGNKGKLLVSIPEDMKFFRSATTGQVVVMGRHTLESLPGQRPLSDRVNFVLSRRNGYAVPGAEIVSSADELMERLRDFADRDVYVIGGEQVYRALLPVCDTAFITKIDYSYEADAYFPNLDELPDWVLVDEGEEETYFDLPYTFCTYCRKKKND